MKPTFGCACHFEKRPRAHGQRFRFRGPHAKVPLDLIDVRWPVDELAKPLEGHGLGRYAQAFAKNRIDFDILSDFSEPDLEKLDIPLGDRKRFRVVA